MYYMKHILIIFYNTKVSEEEEEEEEIRFMCRNESTCVNLLDTKLFTYN